jgi:Glycoside Hydrolase Family 113
VKSRSHRYRVYLLSLMLMAVGALFQALLLTGHIPDVYPGLLPAPTHPPGFYTYQTEISGRDQNPSPVVRMHRPTFETGMTFPQWGQTAYSKGDTNWSIGLSDIQKQTAAQWVEIPINLYQTSVTSTQVTTTAITPTVQSLMEGIHAAKARYYHVFVVPLLSAGGTLTWSGSIRFTTLDQEQAWFASYWQALQPFAAAAAQAGADQLAIGTEFEKLQSAPAFLWHQLIERIHSVFPGRLTYDINWSSLYNPLPTWLEDPLLNMIGVSVYIPLTDTPQRLDPAALPGLWREHIGKLLDKLSVQIHKPVLISEIGYRDSAYALYRPWQRDAAAQAEPPDPEEQAAAYNAALSDALVDPSINGIFFWAWSVPLFEPNWKPAAKILYKWYTSRQA